MKQEVGSGRNPARAVECESATWDQTVQVNMIQQSLIPGMEHGQKPDLAFQMGSAEVRQSLGNGLEEDSEQDLLIDEDQRVQFMRKGKDQMEVAGLCSREHKSPWTKPPAGGRGQTKA